MRINIDDWQEYGIEGIGRQEKKWLLHDGVLYLFKEATIREDGTNVYNDVSECIAADIAHLLGIDCANYFLCERHGVKGIITPNFLNNEIGKVKKEEFISGIDLISKINPGFRNTWLENPETKDLYTISLVLKAVEEYGFTIQKLEKIIFDLLIGNYDRNPSNWGIIKNLETGLVRPAPLYDNCTSLGIPIGNKRIRQDIIEVDGKPIIVDDNHLKVVIHKHIISKIVLEKHFQRDGQKAWYQMLKEQNLPNRAYDFKIMEYQPMIEYLTSFYSGEISDIMERINGLINESNITSIIGKYKDELDVSRQKLAQAIVLERADWMTTYYQQERYSSVGRLIS